MGSHTARCLLLLSIGPCIGLLVSACGQSPGGRHSDGAMDANGAWDASAPSDARIHDLDTVDAGLMTISTVCQDVCADGSLNPSAECGACLGISLGGGCSSRMTACVDDVGSPEDTCLRCGDYLSTCDEPLGCADVALLCPATRTLIDDLNYCLCAVCGGGPPTTEEPGFVRCTQPELPPSPCNDLDKTECIQTVDCRAIFADPCPSNVDCTEWAEFTHCAPVKTAPPAPGGCVGLSQPDCETRDDCVAHHYTDTTNCCPLPPWAMPFIGCLPEPSPPPAPPDCIGLSMEQCLDSADCRPVFIAQSGVAACGVYLTGTRQCQSCWSWHWVQAWGCLPSW